MQEWITSAIGVTGALVGAGVGYGGALAISRRDRAADIQQKIRDAFGLYLGTLYASVAEGLELPPNRPPTRLDRAVERVQGQQGAWLARRRREYQLSGDRYRELAARLSAAEAQLQVLPLSPGLRGAVNAANDYVRRLGEDRSPEIKAEWSAIHSQLMRANSQLGSNMSTDDSSHRLLSRPLTRWGRNRKAVRKEEQEWLDAPVKPIPEELISLARNASERELASREALNARLTTIITFCGALLALALTLGQKAGSVLQHHRARHTIFEIGLTAAIVLLALAILLCILSLRPEPRHRTSAKLLKYYALEGTASDEVRVDTYKFEVALTQNLAPGNTRRATGLLHALWLTAIALGLAAAEAIILFL